jgi:sulfotransferase
MKQFVCLSGLPRSGSTILSAILDQNPLIHAEGNSAVCQFMWDIHQAGTVHAAEQLKGNNRMGTVKDIIQQVPLIYYKDIPAGKEIIVDKCRAWTIASNVELLRTHIDPAIKIIVLERSVTAIMQSFMKLYKNNQWSEEYMHQILKAMLVPNVDPIMRSIIGINMAKKENALRPPALQTFLFIQYDDLIANPAETLERIYKFCGWAPFVHQFANIVNAHPENDEFYRLKGFHTIRATLNKEPNTVILPPDILAKCQQIDRLLLVGGNPPGPPTGVKLG